MQKLKLGHKHRATVVQKKHVSGILTYGNIKDGPGSEAMHSATLALPVQFQQLSALADVERPVKEVPPRNHNHLCLMCKHT